MFERSFDHQPSPNVALLGVPLAAGGVVPSTALGPSQLRAAGLVDELVRRGNEVLDAGDVRPDAWDASGAGAYGGHEFAWRAHDVAEIAAWTRRLSQTAYGLVQEGACPVFLGGDHSLAMGSVSGVARHWAEASREFYLLWLDAHADFNTPLTSLTGNMHGMALAMLTGQGGGEPIWGGEPRAIVKPENVCLLGVRAIDPGEAPLLHRSFVEVVEMERINEAGMRIPVERLLERVRASGGVLHVSLDLDVLDPTIAPGVATPEPGGLGAGQAYRLMELLHDSGCVCSLDVAEFNPPRDVAGKTSAIAVRLAATLLGGDLTERTGLVRFTHEDGDGAA